MPEGITLLIAALLALAAGTALGFWFDRLACRARTEADTQRLRELEDRLRNAEAARDEARAALAQTRERLTQAETTLAHEKASAAEKLAALNDAHARLVTEFKALSADALARNNEEFLKLAHERLAALHQQSAGELEKRQQAIDALVKPLKESLEKVDGRIQEIENARARAYGQLSQHLEQLNAAQVRLQTEAARLSTALSSTRYAGSWGELQLRRVVEMADMLAYVDFAEQQSAGALRADMIIRMPGGQRVVVDAKAPVQSYREAVEALDDATRKARLAEHAQKVRGHIDALGAKSYWEQFQPAPEFVVLFLPGDHFLTAALQADPTLLDRALSRRVLLATPTSLIALLKAAAYGWRQEAISQSAEEISALGRQLYDRVAVFAEHLDRVRNGLEAALRSYNQAAGSFESALLPGARRFAELGARGTKELKPPGTVESTAREITKRE